MARASAIDASPRLFDSVADVASAVGEELGPTPWRLIGQEAVDRFADVTGDWQPLHCDPEAAALTPYGGTIVHGYFTVSLLSSFAVELYRVGRVARVINYGIDRLRFPAAVPVGARIRATATIVSAKPAESHLLLGVKFVVEVEGSAAPGMVAETLVALVADEEKPGRA